MRNQLKISGFWFSDFTEKVTYPAWKNVDSSRFLEEILFLDFDFFFFDTSISIAKVERLLLDQLFEQEHEHLGIILEY